MKTILLACVAIMLTALPVVAGTSGSIDHPAILITTDWLAKHLNDDNLIILHVHSNNHTFKAGHIPGARFLWFNSLSKDSPERSTELPSITDAEAVLKALGIDEWSRIVVYFEGQNMVMSARVIFTLTYLGLGERVALLDGGLDAWKSEGRPVSKVTAQFKLGTYAPKPHPEVVADAEWVRNHQSDSNVAILDARARKFYDGAAGTPPGHIPHALNVPISGVADSTNRMFHPDSLRRLFEKAGVKPGTQIVTYCNVGQAASLLYVAARLAGYDARVYDGSLEDWADRELPVETSAEKK